MDSSAYCASKPGIINLTRELAMELSAYNINVNAIAPGTIATKMVEDFFSKDEKAKEFILSRIPLGRMGRPEEIGRAVVFLASNDSDYITEHT